MMRKVCTFLAVNGEETRENTERRPQDRLPKKTVCRKNGDGGMTFTLHSKQPSTKVEGFATIAETTSHQACLRPAPESPAGNPDPADFDLH